MSELKNIIMIEDEPDIQTIAKMALETVGGFSVETFNSGEEAVQNIQGKNPDLILLDVMMPGLDGPSTLTELRKMPDFANTPIIFMTAKVQPQEVQQYKDLGAVDVISKPFDPMALSQNVKDIWERHHG